MRVTFGDVFVGIAAIAGGTGLLLSYRSSLAAAKIGYSSRAQEARDFRDLRLNIRPTRTPTLERSHDELRGIRFRA